MPIENREITTTTRAITVGILSFCLSICVNYYLQEFHGGADNLPRVKSKKNLTKKRNSFGRLSFNNLLTLNRSSSEFSLGLSDDDITNELNKLGPMCSTGQIILEIIKISTLSVVGAVSLIYLCKEKLVD